MKIVDLQRHRIVKAGLQWPFSETAPNSKNMIPLLERNESLITWMQPMDGKLTDQFPSIRVNETYYTLSLRQMKAVWKHIKLKRNFVNSETIPHVGVKLRIPNILLQEKIRTQQRFNVRAYTRVHGFIISTDPPHPGDARKCVRPLAQDHCAQAH